MGASILSLPFELRSRIYDYYFANADNIISLNYVVKQWSLGKESEAQLQASKHQTSLLLASRQIHADLKDTFWSRLPIHLQATYENPSPDPEQLLSFLENIQFLSDIIKHPRYLRMFTETKLIHVPLTLINALHYLLPPSLPSPSSTKAVLSSLETIIFTGFCTFSSPSMIVDPRSTAFPIVPARSPFDFPTGTTLEAIEALLRRDLNSFRLIESAKALTTVIEYDVLDPSQEKTCTVTALPGSGFGEYDVSWTDHASPDA